MLTLSSKCFNNAEWLCLVFLYSLIRQPFSFVTDNIVVYGRVGGSTTFKCSTEGHPGSVEEYTGLYLYWQEFQEKEEVYNHRQTDNISPQKKFINRTETTGFLMNHTITISSLTMEDAGFYYCVYVKENDHRVQCKSYILIIRGVLERSPVHSNSPFLMTH